MLAAFLAKLRARIAAGYRRLKRGIKRLREGLIP